MEGASSVRTLEQEVLSKGKSSRERKNKLVCEQLFVVAIMEVTTGSYSILNNKQYHALFSNKLLNCTFLENCCGTCYYSIGGKKGLMVW